MREPRTAARKYPAILAVPQPRRSLARLDEIGMRASYACSRSQDCGAGSAWRPRGEGVRLGGMGARNGVTAALGHRQDSPVSRMYGGEHNVRFCLTQPNPPEMVAGLGSRFFVTETAIKTFSVGYPIQAPLDAFLTLRRAHGLTVNNVERIVVRLPEDGARIVDNSPMPDVNCQVLIAVALVDGAVSFSDSHSHERMADPQILAARARVQLVADRMLMDPEAPRSGLVEVTLRDGRTVSHFTRHPPGTKENPLDSEGVAAKVRDLMAPVLGLQRTDAIIQRINALEDVVDVRALRPLLTE